jgi:hypothetical protein
VRFRTKPFWMAAYILVAIWTLWPIASVLVANIFAATFHCRLSESGSLPCHAFGRDISHELYVLATAFWFALTTLPTGVPLILLVAAVHLCVTLIRRRRSRG